MFLLGIDIGSTTVKITIADYNYRLKLYKYEKHYANQTGKLIDILKSLKNELQNDAYSTVITGSGGEPVADLLKTKYIQEVVSSSLLIKKKYPETKTAIELGGQDAKIIFFKNENKNLIVDDMQMNGICAGGTGSFLEQIANLLNVNIESFDKLAENGKNIHNIAGRCGVFATTDIQALLNEGVSKEDIILSSYYALANQTIAGLTKGKLINKKLLFIGGVFSFHKTLIKVFCKILKLNPDDIIIPQNSENFVSYGAATAVKEIYNYDVKALTLNKIIDLLENKKSHYRNKNSFSFFKNTFESEKFKKRIQSDKLEIKNNIENNKNINIFIGIDSGSTTSKFVFLDLYGNIIDYFYKNNMGNPIETIKCGLEEKLIKYQKKNIHLNIKSIGTTGYGKDLISKAFNANYNNVETIAHYKSAIQYYKKPSFILDIGGQDIKAIYIKNSVITNTVLNEACSSGCGAFLENYSKTIGIDIKNISDIAFKSENPSALGSRCTVFTNSSVTTELKEGKNKNDIAAGLCMSLVENIFTKVIRCTNIENLGNNIIIQGGVSNNLAVLRAIEIYIKKEIKKPKYPELMGAIGIALLAKEHIQKNNINLNSNIKTIINSTYQKKYTECKNCSNRCNILNIEFSNGQSHKTGYKCNNNNITKIKSYDKDNINLLNKYLKNIFKTDPKSKVHLPKKVGIPRVLDFYEMYPFWKTFFDSLGLSVVLSSNSSSKILNSGLVYVPSDTVCLPGKISHGHIIDLVSKGVDKIFWPLMITKSKENKTSQSGCFCPILQGYSQVIKNNHTNINNIEYLNPIFHWYNKNLMRKQILDYFKCFYSKNTLIKAIENAEKAQYSFKLYNLNEGKKLLEKSDYEFGVVIVGRPYQYDLYINHNLTEYFTKLNIPVLIYENIPKANKTNISTSRNDNHILYHNRIIEAAYYVSKHPKLELIQLVSFGCGHESILTDEVKRILNDTSKKEPLQIKLDEMESNGSIKLRIQSFIETVKIKRNIKANTFIKKLDNPYKVKFNKNDIKKRTIIAPYLAPTFSYVVSKVFNSQGFNFIQLIPGGEKEFQLGKKYLHNDICFPAQVNMGEIFSYLDNLDLENESVAIILSKNCDYCRSGQYQVAARQALDAKGYMNIPILTTGIDYKNMHPGYTIDIDFKSKMIRALIVTDILEKMYHRIKPYEKNKGESKKLFNKWRKILTDLAIKKNKLVKSNLKKAVIEFNNLKLKSNKRKTVIGVIGEILVEYHKGANRNIIKGIEDKGFEIYIPSITDFFRRESLIRKNMTKRNMIPNSWITYILSSVEESYFKNTYDNLFKEYRYFKFSEDSHDAEKIMNSVGKYIDESYIAGEGWLIPGYIDEMTNYNIRSFLVIQPFGCMSNHITGRGMFNILKKNHPNLNLLSLDYDPDTSLANINNRLDMFLYRAKNLL